MKLKITLPICLFVFSLGCFALTYSKSSAVNAPDTQQAPTEQRTDKQETAAKQAKQQSIVTFENATAKQAFLRDNNIPASALQPTGTDKQYVAPVPASKANDTAGVETTPRRTYRPLAVPNDPLYPQNFLTSVAAPKAWDISKGDSGETIAVIDTGFALEHVDLNTRWSINDGEYGNGKETNGVDDDGNGRIDDWRGWDFVKNDNAPQAGTTNSAGVGTSHGTLAAGLAGAASNNGVGIASMNWGARILPLQVLDDDGIGYTEDIVSAVNYATSRGVKIINLSLGGTASDPALQTAIKAARQAGVTVIAAAGNCGDPDTYAEDGCTKQGQILYPAVYPEVISVGAATSTDARATFSSYGPALDLMAPGSGAISSTSWSASNQTSAYANRLYGTSFATPIVAGTAALLRSSTPNLSPSDIELALRRGTDKTTEMKGAERTDEAGSGRLNAYKSVKFASTPHPDGALVRANGDTTVYLIENGQRRQVGSPAVFASQGFDASRIRLATPADMRLPAGESVYFREGVLLRGSGPAVYAIDYQGSTLLKRHITTASAFTGLGYSDANVLSVKDNELPAANGTAIASADVHPDGTLVRAANSSAVFLIESSQRRYIGSPEVFSSLGYTSNAVRTATKADSNLARTSDTYFREGTLVKDTNPAVYAVDKDGDAFRKRHINEASTFLLLDYTSVAKEVFTVPTSALPTADGTSL